MATNLPKHVEHWDDERDMGSGVIVTLRLGHSFEPREHAGVRGFDTVTEAREASRLKNVYPCACPLCNKETGR